MNETIELLMKRKSVRAYEKREISEEIKEKVVEAALRAPTAGNMVFYSILDIEDQKMKDRLVETCDDQPMIGKAPWVLVFIADFRKWMDYFELCNVEKVDRELGQDRYKPGAGDFMLCVNDAMIAAQNAVVAAQSLGVGSCYIGDVMENYEIHREMFDLPDYTFPVGMLCFGYPTESQEKRIQSTRFPRESVVFKDKYKRLNSDEFGRMYEKMEEQTFKGKYLPGCENIGQHYYKRKTSSEFMREMNRSVTKAIEMWCK